MKRVFQLAVEQRQLDENPLGYVKPPRFPRKEIRVYSPDEQARMTRAASDIQNEAILERDLLITVALTTGMRKSELLNLVCSNIDFGEMAIEISPKDDTEETWELRVRDTDRRWVPLTEDVGRILAALQDGRPAGYPYVFVPPDRYDHIQKDLRQRGKWSLVSARNSVINNFKRQFDRILARAHIES